MIIEQKKWGFVTAQIILDDELARRVAVEKKYDRIAIISNTKLALEGFRVREKQTGVIPFEGGPAAVLSRFAKTTRNEIARTFRDPLFVVRERDTVSDDTYRVYVDFEKKLHRVPFAQETFKGCREFVVLYDGEILSGVFVFESEPVARIRSIFSKRSMTRDHTEYQRVGYASRRALYEACVWGSGRGCTGLDLASVNSPDETKRGINDFKMGFNPTVVSEYTYTYRTLLYSLFEHAMMVGRHTQRFIRAFW